MWGWPVYKSENNNHHINKLHLKQTFTPPQPLSYTIYWLLSGGICDVNTLFSTVREIITNIEFVWQKVINDAWSFFHNLDFFIVCVLLSAYYAALIIGNYTRMRTTKVFTVLTYTYIFFIHNQAAESRVLSSPTAGKNGVANVAYIML